MAGQRPAADWRDAAYYAPLSGADRAIFAWEWLRRSQAYRTIDERADVSAFGLVRWEAPTLDWRDARPIWHRDWHDAVLACDIGESEPIDFGALGLDICIAASPAGAHLLLTDGLRTLRLDGPACLAARRAVSLRFWIDGMGNIDVQSAALLRLRGLLLGQGLSASPSRRAARWIAALRVHDALDAGASYREIAASLFGDQVVGPRWWLDTPSWGLRIARLAAASRAALAAGPRPWLCSAPHASAPPAD